MDIYTNGICSSYKRYQPLIKFTSVFIIPIVLLPLPIMYHSKEARAAYVVLLVSIYWCTEVLPLGITGLVPAFLLPLLGIIPSKDVTKNYMKEDIMLCMAAYTVAVSVEKWNLHKRISLNVLLTIGISSSRLVLGVMLTTMLLSMFINNTATATIMIPVVEAVLQQLYRHLVHRPRPPRSPRFNDSNTGSENGFGEKSVNQSLDSEAMQLGQLGAQQENVTVTRMPVDGMMTERQHSNICKAMCLAVAYGSSFGGSATIIGTGAIILAKAQIESVFENYNIDAGFTFTKWLAYSLPVSVLGVLVAWLWLQFYWWGFRNTLRGWFGSLTDVEKQTNLHIQNLLQTELKHLGKMRFAEKIIAGHFIIMILLWLFRKPGLFPGWLHLFPEGYVGASIPALLTAVSLFIFPSRPLFRKHAGCRYETIMDVRTMSKKVPWHLLLLFGGGMALADACKVSGLSKMMGEKMTVLEAVPGWLLVTVVCLIISFFTEFTSNMAVVSIVMPILARMCLAMKQNPMRLMIPSTLACTYAFMLPVATPPNAVVFSFGHLRVMDMVKTGFVLNMFAVLINSIAANTWGVAIFSYDQLPSQMLMPPNITSLPLDLACPN